MSAGKLAFPGGRSAWHCVSLSCLQSQSEETGGRWPWSDPWWTSLAHHGSSQRMHIWERDSALRWRTCSRVTCLYRSHMSSHAERTHGSTSPPQCPVVLGWRTHHTRLIEYHSLGHWWWSPQHSEQCCLLQVHHLALRGSPRVLHHHHQLLLLWNVLHSCCYCYSSDVYSCMNHASVVGIGSDVTWKVVTIKVVLD